MYPYSVIFFLLACINGIMWAAGGNPWCKVQLILFGVLFLMSVPIGAMLRERRLEKEAPEEEGEEDLLF